MRLTYDCEADALLDELTVIHSLCIQDIVSGKEYSFADQDGYRPIAEGLAMLENAQEIWAHNGICFDTRALRKVYPTWWFKGKSMDTLVMSRLLFPDLWDKDMRSRKIGNKKLWGSHGLEAWGYRVNVQKGDFGKQNGWEHWSEEMQRYCEQDVRVLTALVKLFEGMGYAQKAIDLEHEFQEIIADMEINGVPFDVPAAEKLAAEITIDVEKYRIEVAETTPPWEEIFMPKSNNKTRGYVKGEPFIKYKPFNVGSRQQIIKYFKEKYNWEPDEFTDKGNPKIGEDTLRALPYVEADLFANYFERAKVLAQLSTGKQAWLKNVVNGRIHGRVNTVGARTRRCTHSGPNLAQVPSPRAWRGDDCRRLFYAPEGWVFVGADMSGLELRMLAHYLHPYDGGEYANQVLNGDIHTINQEAAGLPTRDNAKTFIYGYLYGAGDEKIGEIVDPLANQTAKKARGKQLRSSFLRRLPALKRLGDAVKVAHRQRKGVNAPDGGYILSISEHSALNTLLQGAGAVACKMWAIVTWEMIREQGLEDKVQAVLNVHDEQQMLVKEGYEEQVGKIMEQATTKAGERLGFKIRLDGEYKSGRN